MTTRALALMVCSLVALSPAAARGDTHHQEASLAGLSGVRIVVEEPDDDLGADGLTEMAVRKEIESPLKAAGIRILNDREWAAAPGRPALKAEITAKSAGRGTRVFVVEIDVEQDVRLARDAARTVSATTWSAPVRLGMLSPSAVTVVLQAVREAVGDFLAAWRKVNPNR